MLCPQATPCCCRLLPGDSKSEAGGPRGGGQCSWQEVEWPWRGQDTGRLRHHVRSGPAEAKGERDGRAEAGEHPQASDCCIGHKGLLAQSPGALEPWRGCIYVQAGRVQGAGNCVQCQGWRLKVLTTVWR